VSRELENSPHLEPEPQEVAQLREQLQSADMDSADAWRAHEDLHAECNAWKVRALAEQEKLIAMRKSFSWWVTTPIRELDRMQARLRRSVAKRMSRLGNAVRRLSGREQAQQARTAAPAKDAEPDTAVSQKRQLMSKAAAASAESFLQGPRAAERRKLQGGSSPEFAVYFNTSGNYFFQEIALLLHAALREAGFHSVLRTDEQGGAADADFHLIVAPHEFFPLGKGATCFHESLRDRIFLLNTEQPQTQWFGLAKLMFPYARHIFDMDLQTAAAIQASGFAASHLAPGFVENFAPYTAAADLPIGPETEALGSEVRRWRDTGRSLAERPIDLSFVGEATPRRSAFFAGAAALVEKYECHLRLMPMGAVPWTSDGIQIHRRTLVSAGLSQRSKIVINVHRDREQYFEWHRIVQMGIWQRALVLTETVPETPPFVAGRDYVQATLEEMPGLIEYYLQDPRGIEEAERIRNSGYEQLKSRCDLPGFLKQAWVPFLSEAR
jgi:hypothetical protein